MHQLSVMLRYVDSFCTAVLQYVHKYYATELTVAQRQSTHNYATELTVAKLNYAIELTVAKRQSTHYYMLQSFALQS
jgi:hypothetical protein